VILDYIGNVEVDENLYHQQLFALKCLSRGLADLYDSVENFEIAVQSYELERRKRVSFMGEDLGKFGIDSSVEYLLPCYFHWFSNTLCNYARLVGVFKALSDNSVSYADITQRGGSAEAKKLCDSYVSSISDLTEVLSWRNKVAAHFSISDPRKNDTSALLQGAGFNSVAYDNSRFRVEVFVGSLNGEESNLPSWSLTEKFEKLAPRFWPEFTK
jgi:hypothetical protein